MVDISAQNQETVSMSPNRMRLRIGLWALVLILLGFTMGLKIDELPNFSASTDVSTNSEIGTDEAVDLLGNDAVSNSFIQAIKYLGDGNIYQGIQKMIGEGEISADLSSRINSIHTLFVGKALAQIPPCSQQYQDLFSEGFKEYLTDFYQKDMGSIGNPCVEMVKITGKVTYTIYRKGTTHYVTMHITDFKANYYVWQKRPNGDCVRVIQKTRKKDEIKVVQINSDGTYEEIPGVPAGSKQICQSVLNFDVTANNPKFDKEKCCGKKKKDTTPPIGTEQ